MENVNKHSTSIKNWSIDDRPREKLQTHGATYLSNAELIAILLGSGNQKESAIDIGKKIMNMCNHNLQELGKLSLKDLQKIKGIGEAKSILITAAVELGRRRSDATLLKKIVVKSSTEVAAYLIQHLKDLPYEVFAVVFLNRGNKIIHFEIISKGGITGTVADPRIILKLALNHGATSIILSHNHPSGNLQPSHADIELTKKIKQAAEIMDIKLLDHIIVSEEGYYSFMDEAVL